MKHPYKKDTSFIPISQTLIHLKCRYVRLNLEIFITFVEKSHKGALSIHGIRAGSMLMSAQPELFTNLVWLSVVGNIFLLIFGMMGIRIFAKLVEIPRNVLLPLIIVISVIGSYSINNMALDIVWTLIAGVIGYFLKFYGVPVAPLVLGLILGPTIEVNLRRSIISAGSVGGMFADIFTHPLSLILLLILVLMMVTQVLSSRKRAGAN